LEGFAKREAPAKAGVASSAFQPDCPRAPTAKVKNNSKVKNNNKIKEQQKA